MKKRTRIVVISAIVLFVLLFAGSFVYELSTQRGVPIPLNDGFEEQSNVMVQSSRDESYGIKSKNFYESKRIEFTQAGSVAQVLDQKYERVSTISSRSKDYEGDVKNIRTIIEEFKAIVQQENVAGLKGARVLVLSIGVVPDSFEQAVERLKAVGSLLSFEITKTDKTSDYKALEAKRISLEKTRDGLKALRKSSAALADLVTLETRILDIEGQIQDLGVSLGDFDANNSFSTIHVTLSEREEKTVGPNVLRALLDALSFTVWTYLGMVLAVVVLGVLILLVGVVTEKIIGWKKALEAANSRNKE